MKASQLRDLTRRYAAGNLDRDEYLAQRTRLIDGIVAGEIEIHYRELDPAAESAQGVTSQAHWLLTGGVIMLVGLLLIALLAYFLDDGATPVPGNVAAASTSPSPGMEQLEQFMETGDWSEASLEHLESEWIAMSAFQRENARRSAPFRRLKRETTQRITEQEALLAAGKMEALLKAARLRDFAERLGMEPGS